MSLDRFLDYAIPVWALVIFSLCAYAQLWLICANLMAMFALAHWYRSM